MILIKTAATLRLYLSDQKKKGLKIGFIPTMGALHEGHISLIKHALDNRDIPVCSIFINPTQFNDEKDFRQYPVTINQDILLLEKAGCEALFLPSVDEIYPTGFENETHYELGYLGSILEGAYRPGHFQGVCQVMEKLLKIVMPDRLYLGQKDFQQCKIIALLIKQMSLQERIKVEICPTMREPDGLAMSSRNRRINPEVRKNANGIFLALSHLKNHLKPGPLEPLLNEASHILVQKGFEIDYLTIADAGNLEILTEFQEGRSLIALTAATFDEVRLIDNMLLNQD